MGEHAGLLLLGVLAFLALIPLSTAAFQSTSIFNIDYTHMQLKFRFYDLSLARYIHAAAILFGAALGFSLGLFLLQRKKATFYLALGVTRGALLRVRFLAGGLILLAAIAGPMAVSLCLNRAALGFSSGIVSYFLADCAGLLLSAFTAMVIFFIGCCLGGNAAEAFLYSAALLLSPTAVLYGVNTAMKLLLLGNVWGAETYYQVPLRADLLQQFSFLNPALFFSGGAEDYGSFTRSLSQAAPSPVAWSLLVGWGLAAVGLTLVALWLFRRKKAENAEIAGLSPAMDTFTILIAAFGAFGAAASLSSGLGALPAVFIGVCASLFCFAIFAGSLLRLPLTPRRIGVPLLTQLGVIFALCAVMATGFFGYASRVPAVADIASAQVSYVGSPSYLPAAPSGSSTGADYYLLTTVTLSDPDSLALLTSLHEDLIAQGTPALCVDTGDFESTGVPYDVSVTYTLKSGGTVSRYYSRSTLRMLEELLALDDTAEVRSGMGETIRGTNTDNVYTSQAYASGDIYFSDPLYSSVRLAQLTDTQRAALLDAIAEDVSAQSTRERYFPSKAALGVILFTTGGETAADTFAYDLSNALVYVTSDFTHTLALLDSWGGGDWFSSGAEVESVTLQAFTPYARVGGLSSPISLYFMAYASETQNDFIVSQDFGTKPVITDASQLSRLLPLLRSDYFMSGGGYLACVKLRDSDRCVYLFLPASDAPDFVTSKF